MKLFELLQEETRPEYFKRLAKDLNIKKLGKGAFATVFQHPVYHNVAVKYLEDDPNYIKFVKFCQANPNNRWLPKVVGFDRIKMDDEYTRGSTYLVFFQKLRKASMKDIKAAAQEIMASVPDEYFETNDPRSWHKKKLKPRSFYSIFNVFDYKEWRIIEKHSTDKDIRKFATFMLTQPEHDIHENNVMMRDEGGASQLVFTDPVVS